MCHLRVCVIAKLSIITIFAFEIKWVSSYSTDFAELKSKRYFVDKSQLLRVFFETSSPYNLISCPQRFAKTTNLQMIETFSQLELDSEGNAKHYTNTRAYELFNDTAIFKRHPDIIRQHMSRYVVIYLDLALNTKIDYFTEDVVIEIMNEKLFECLETTVLAMEQDNHRSLLNITKENLEAKGIRNENIAFLDKLKLRRLNETEVVYGLGILANILHTYFRSNVCVLIDEYDKAMIPNVLSNPREDVELLYIYINEMIITLLQNADKCNLSKVLVTTTSNLASGVSYPDLRDFRQNSFLDDHEFHKFYGFSHSELDHLMDLHDVNQPDDRTDTRRYYCGYRTAANEPLDLCNPYSVSRHFDKMIRNPDEDPLKTYWIPDKLDENQLLVELLNYVEFRQIASSLVTNKGVSFRRADFETPPTRMDFLNFLNFCKQKNVEYRQYTYGLFLNFVLGQGFLSYGPRRNVFVAPNSEIKDILREALFWYRTSSKEMLKDMDKFTPFDGR